MKQTKVFGRVAMFLAYLRAPRATYLLRHPLTGTRNLLALKGAKSLLRSRGAVVTAAVATGVVAVPLVAKAVSHRSRD